MKWLTSCSQWGYVPQSVVFNKSGRLSKQLGCRYLKFPVLTRWTRLISTTVLCLLKLGRKKKEQDVYEARRAVLSLRSPAVGNPCKPRLLTASSMSMCFKHTGSTSVPNWKTFSMAHRICLFEAISGTKLRIECPPCYEYKHYQMLVLAVCRLLLSSPPGGTASDLRHGVDVTLRHI